jgi:molybdenum cofactor synthesis domain-containing protein
MEQINATLVTIGDELLIGQTIDTNSAWMARQLNLIGIWVRNRVAIGDEPDAILETLADESRQSDLILITGGLGPTADDRTKRRSAAILTPAWWKMPRCFPGLRRSSHPGDCLHWNVICDKPSCRKPAGS